MSPREDLALAAFPRCTNSNNNLLHLLLRPYLPRATCLPRPLVVATRLSSRLYKYSSSPRILLLQCHLQALLVRMAGALVVVVSLR